MMPRIAGVIWPVARNIKLALGKSTQLLNAQLVHAVELTGGTTGAQLRDDLHIPHAELVLRKGYHRDIDSYSAFYENDRTTHTGLAGYLRERGFRRVFIAGLAFDFCVRFSAEDAKREGFEVTVVACRGIDIDRSVLATRQALAALGIALQAES